VDLSGFPAVLQKLVDREVEFIVVGGVAALLIGAPVITFDLDIVHSRAPENLTRLVAALRDLDAHYRHRPEFRPDESHLATKGHQLLRTAFRYLDVLGAIGAGRTYEDLLPHTEIVEIHPGLRVRVLDMETQIAVKEETGRDKDIAVLPTLRRTLIESRRLKEG
jgi:predicted nucleotidyltransferase